MSPSGLDQSWGYANPAAAKAAGVQVVSMYLSWDSSKNVTAAKVKAYHAVGIGVLLNWESQAGAPLKGTGQGKADAPESVRQIKALIAAVGYAPKNRLTDYFSCDQDTNSSQWGSIDAYYTAARDICHAAGYGVGVYGEAQLVTHLHAAGITDSEWQTYAWSGGVLSPDADFYQYQNGQTLGGASVDFDRVIHPADLGAWWPPGSTYDSASPSEDTVSAADVITALSSGPGQDELKKAVTTAMAQFLIGTDGKQYGFLTVMEQAIKAVSPAPATVAAAVVAALPPSSTGGLTPADVEKAVADVLGRTTLSAPAPVAGP